MNRDSLARMRLDRRLMTRRGWIGAAELDRALDALPDVADKAITLGTAEDTATSTSLDPEETPPPLA